MVNSGSTASSAIKPGFGLGIYHSPELTRPAGLYIGIEYSVNYKYVDYIADSKYQQGVDWNCSISTVNIPIGVKGNLNNNVNIIFGGFLSLATQINRVGIEQINGVNTGNEVTINEKLLPKAGFLAAIGYQFKRKRISPYFNLEGRLAPGNFSNGYTKVMNNYFRIVLGINLRSKDNL